MLARRTAGQDQERVSSWEPLDEVAADAHLTLRELANASDIMMAHPLALQLRNLQTLIEISVDKNSTSSSRRRS